MVFVLYKVRNKDNSILISEVFEKEEDAKDKMKLLTDDKTPEEKAEETYSIQETWYTTTAQYNFPEPPFKYSEEDNSIDETDLESTNLHKRKNESIDYEKIIEELSKRIVVKTINNDNSDLYLYVYFCFILLVFLIFTLFISVRYIP